MYDEAAGHFAAMLFQQRMRVTADREVVSRIFTDVWGQPLPDLGQQAVTVTPSRFSIGRAFLQRSSAGDQHAILHVPCMWVRQVTCIVSTLDMALSGRSLPATSCQSSREQRSSSKDELVSVIKVTQA